MSASDPSGLQGLEAIDCIPLADELPAFGIVDSRLPRARGEGRSQTANGPCAGLPGERWTRLSDGVAYGRGTTDTGASVGSPGRRAAEKRRAADLAILGKHHRDRPRVRVPPERGPHPAEHDARQDLRGRARQPREPLLPDRARRLRAQGVGPRLTGAKMLYIWGDKRGLCEIK